MPTCARRAGTAGPLLLAAVALVGAGCHSSGIRAARRHPKPTAVLKPHCPAPTQPPAVTADGVNQVVSSSDLPAWQAGDIGASAELSDGRLVWVFGYTVRTDDFNPRIVANSMLISSGRCVSQLRPRDDGPVIPDVSSDVVRWPMSLVVLGPVGAAAGTGVRDALVVLCARTQRGGAGGALDFVFRGTSAAVFTVSDDGVPRLQEVVEITPDDAAPDQVNWARRPRSTAAGTTSTGPGCPATPGPSAASSTPPGRPPTTRATVRSGSSGTAPPGSPRSTPRRRPSQRWGGVADLVRGRRRRSVRRCVQARR